MTGYNMCQSDISDGRHDEATLATSRDHGHDEATRGWYDEHSTEACTENTGLLIRETRKDDNESLPKKHQRNIFLV